MTLVSTAARGSSGGGLASIADQTLAVSSPSFDFLGLSQSYSHIWIVCYLRTDAASVADAAAIRLNNDSGANYYQERIVANGATATPGETLAATSGTLIACAGGTASANHFGAGFIVLPSYAQATNHKSMVAQSHYDQSNLTGTIIVAEQGVTWVGTAAVSRITLIPTTGTNFVAGSRVTLYGMI